MQIRCIHIIIYTSIHHGGDVLKWTDQFTSESKCWKEVIWKQNVASVSDFTTQGYTTGSWWRLEPLGMEQWVCIQLQPGSVSYLIKTRALMSCQIYWELITPSTIRAGLIWNAAQDNKLITKAASRHWFCSCDFRNPIPELQLKRAELDKSRWADRSCISLGKNCSCLNYIVNLKCTNKCKFHAV